MMRRKKARHMSHLYGSRRKSSNATIAAHSATTTVARRTMSETPTTTTAPHRERSATRRERMIAARATAVSSAGRDDLRHERRQHFESCLRNEGGGTNAVAFTTTTTTASRRNFRFLHQALQREEESIWRDNPTSEDLPSSNLARTGSPMHVVSSTDDEDEEEIHDYYEEDDHEEEIHDHYEEDDEEDIFDHYEEELFYSEEVHSSSTEATSHREWRTDLQRLQEQEAAAAATQSSTITTTTTTMSPIVFTESDSDSDDGPYFQEFPQDDSRIAAALQHEECLLQVDRFISSMEGAASSRQSASTLHAFPNNGGNNNNNNIDDDATIAAALQRQEYDDLAARQRSFSRETTTQRQDIMSQSIQPLLHPLFDSNRLASSDDPFISFEDNTAAAAAASPVNTRSRRGRASSRRTNPFHRGGANSNSNGNDHDATTTANQKVLKFCQKVEELQMGLDSFTEEIILSTKGIITPHRHHLVQKLLDLQKEFQSQGKPSQVDIAYYCHHGDGRYGHGVYTSTEPCMSKNENKGIILARLQGTTATVTSGTIEWHKEVDTKLNRQNKEMVVLNQSSQCVPLMGFGRSMLSSASSSSSNKTETNQLLLSVQEALKKLVDQCFNKKTGRRRMGSSSFSTSSMLPDFFPVLHSTLKCGSIEGKDDDGLCYREVTSSSFSASYDCAICLDPMSCAPPRQLQSYGRGKSDKDSHKTVISLKGCGHEFHLKCIKELMKHNFSDCPLCKRPVLNEAKPRKNLTLRMRAHCYIHKSHLSSGAILLEYEVSWSERNLDLVKTQVGCLPNTEPGWMLLRRLHHGFLSNTTFLEDGSGSIRWEPIHRTISLTTGRLWDDLFFHRCNEELDRLGIPPAEDCESHWNQIITYSNQDEGMDFLLSSFVPNLTDIRVIDNTNSRRPSRFHASSWSTEGRHGNSTPAHLFRDIKPETLLKHMTKKDPSLNQLSRSLLQYAGDRKKRLSCDAQLRERLEHRIQSEGDITRATTNNSDSSENPKKSHGPPMAEGAVTQPPIIYQEPLQIRQTFARASSDGSSSCAVYQEPLQVCQSFARAAAPVPVISITEGSQGIVRNSREHKNESVAETVAAAAATLSRSKREARAAVATSSAQQSTSTRSKSTTNICATTAVLGNEESNIRSESTRELSSHRSSKRESNKSAKQAPRGRSGDERPKRGADANKELKRRKQDETVEEASTNISSVRFPMFRAHCRRSRSTPNLEVEHNQDSKLAARPVRGKTTTNHSNNDRKTSTAAAAPRGGGRSNSSDSKKRSPSSSRRKMS